MKSYRDLPHPKRKKTICLEYLSQMIIGEGLEFGAFFQDGRYTNPRREKRARSDRSKKHKEEKESSENMTPLNSY